MANVWKKMQRSDADFTGNVTGKLNNVAAATVTSNAAAGATRNKIFRQASVPTALNAGDSWFDTDDGNRAYWATAAGDNQIGNGEWIDITPNKNSIGLGNVANTTAPVQFRQDSIPTSLAVGDIWTDTDDDNKMYRAASVGADAITSGEWESITPGKAAVGLPDVINVIQTVTFSQDSIPTSTAVNDVWIDTDDGNKQYVAKSVGANAIATGKWEEVTPSKGAIGLDNVSNVTAPTSFAQDGIPTSLAIGDIWTDTNDSNKMYRAASVGANEITSGEWVAISIQKGGLGLVKGDVGLGSVDNDSTADIRAGVTKANVGLSNVDNQSVATIYTSPAFTGTPTGITKGHVGLGSVDNDSTADIRSGVTKANVGLSNVDNQSVATIYTSPAFTGTPTGITKGHVGLSAVTNDVQIKSDGSNAPNILKNSQITLSADSGTVTLNNAGTGSFTKGSIGLGSVDNDSTADIRSGTTKANVGLSSVIDQAITIDSTTKSLKIDGTAQDLNATALGGDSKATLKAAAVSTAETNIIGSAPGALNTLDELAAALNDNASYHSSVTSEIATKQKAPIAITSNDAANSSYDNDPTAEAQGQIGVYNGNLYQVVDV